MYKRQVESEPSPQQKTSTHDEVVRVKEVLGNKGLKEEEKIRRETRQEQTEVYLIEERERRRRMCSPHN